MEKVTDLAIDHETEFSGSEVLTRLREENDFSPIFSLRFLSCFAFTLHSSISSFVDEKYSGRFGAIVTNITSTERFSYLPFVARRDECNARSPRNIENISYEARGLPPLSLSVRFADRDHESSAEASLSF